MGWTHRSEIGHDQTFGLIAKRLRDDNQEVTREPLPKRWVELIHYLDEQERKSFERSRSSAVEPPSLAEAELAVTKQETLGELLRTDEPTDKATALLEHLRTKVARAVAGKFRS